MAKYYMVKTYTCHCDDEVCHYLKIEDNEMIESPKYMDIINGWIGNDEYKWYGYDIYEITKSEYEYDTRNGV